MVEKILAVGDTIIHHKPSKGRHFRYGAHYWMWDVVMDCAQTLGGYFEVKGYTNSKIEEDANQSTCDGETAGVEIHSKNHVGK